MQRQEEWKTVIKKLLVIIRSFKRKITVSITVCQLSKNLDLIIVTKKNNFTLMLMKGFCY